MERRNFSLAQETFRLDKPVEVEAQMAPDPIRSGNFVTRPAKIALAYTLYPGFGAQYQDRLTGATLIAVPAAALAQSGLFDWEHSRKSLWRRQPGGFSKQVGER